MVFLLCLILGAASGFSAAAIGPGDNPVFKRQNIKVDRSGRTINSRGDGKINYLWADPTIDLKERGNSKATSVISNDPIENTPSESEKPRPDFSSIPVEELPYVEKWRTGVFGENIGQGGIIAEDIDLDGKTEIVCSARSGGAGGNNFWYILEYMPSERQYVRKHISDPYPEGIVQISAFDLDASGTSEILLGLSTGRILIYDSSSLEQIGSIDSPADSIRHMEFADGDNDSQKEIIFCDSSTMYFCDPATLTLEHQIPFSASDFEVGNVDLDSATEIILASGQVLEFDGLSTTVEWDYPEGEFGFYLEISDIDSDGIEEIIGASAWYYITAFDADIQSSKWQIRARLDIRALLMSDVNGDGVEELLYGDAQGGDIHCYDAVTVTEKGWIDNPEPGVTQIAVSDVDADGDLEILWGAGNMSTGKDHLLIYGIPSLSLEWQNQHIDGPFHAIDVGDVDSDGRDEIVYASSESNSGYDGGVIFICDAVTHVLEWQSPESMFGMRGIHDLEIGDVDDDGEQEIVVATDDRIYGAIYVINGKTHELENCYDSFFLVPVFEIEIADIDNDGRTEIIAGDASENSLARGIHVYVLDGSSGIIEWSTMIRDGFYTDVYSLEVGDIDNDGVLEIVATNDNIFVIDGISHQLWQSDRLGAFGLDLFDIDNDGIRDIVAGTEGGNIIALDGQSYAEKLNIRPSYSPIVGLQAYDIGQDGSTEIIYGSGGRLNIFGIDDSALLWQSDEIGAEVGERNSLVVSPISSEKTPQIIVGTDYTVVEFAAAELTNIHCVSPANESVISSPPAFIWTTDGGANNVFSIEVALSLRGPYYSTMGDLGHLIPGTEWTMPPKIWDRIPSQSFVYWRVCGADLDHDPLALVYSDEIWFFYKP